MTVKQNKAHTNTQIKNMQIHVVLRKVFPRDSNMRVYAMPLKGLPKINKPPRFPMFGSSMHIKNSTHVHHSVITFKLLTGCLIGLHFIAVAPTELVLNLHQGQ